MRSNPHLTFNGNFREAFELYAECLGAEIAVMLTYGELPSAVIYPDLKTKSSTQPCVLGESKLTGVDLSAADYKVPEGFSLQLDLISTEDAKRIYDKLSEHGTVSVPLQKTLVRELRPLHRSPGTPWRSTVPSFTCAPFTASGRSILSPKRAP